MPTADVDLNQGQEGQLTSGFQNPSTRWSRPTKYVVGVGLFIAMVFVVYISRSSLSMIIFAALLAFVVHPIVKFFQRRLNLRRGQSVGIAYVLVIALLILIPLLFIPAIVESINDALSKDWQSTLQEISSSLESAAEKLSSIPVVGSVSASAVDALSQLFSSASTLGTPEPVAVDVSAENVSGQLAQSLGKLASVLGPLISAVISLGFMVLISLRMSLAVDDMREAYPKLVPPKFRDEIINLIDRIIKVWTSFLSGELSLMVIMGFLTFLLNFILGTPYPVFLGVLAGFLEVIPNLGPVLATIPAIILALVEGSSRLDVSNLAFAIILLLGYLFLTGLENQVLVPKVLGDAVSLPPLVVIIGVVVGGAVYGLLGVLLATPIISTGKVIFLYLYNKILEAPPVDAPPEEKDSILDSLKKMTKRFRIPSLRRQKKLPPDQSPAGKADGSFG